MKGGNDEIYANGRKEFVQSLIDQHPDVVKMVWRYDRWHHEVNYKPFKKNKLILKDDIILTDKINNYGMTLIDENKNNKVVTDHESYINYEDIEDIETKLNINDIF